MTSILIYIGCSGEVKVIRQVMVAFSIGKYDEVVYDAMLIQASHLIGMCYMMRTKICIPLSIMVTSSHLHHYHPKKCILIK